MEAQDGPDYFDNWKDLFNKWDQWNNHELRNKINSCLNFSMNLDNISNIIIGVDSLQQLKNLYRHKIINDFLLPDYLCTEDEDLLDPRRWQNMTFEQTQKDIVRLIETSKVKFVSKKNAIEDWIFIQNTIDYLPVLYSVSSINYQEQYFTEQSDQLFDLSQVIYWDNKPIGILSLTLSSKDKDLFLTSQGHPVLRPLVLDQIPKVHKKIFNECAYLVHTVIENYKIKEFCLQEIYSSNFNISSWYEYFLIKNFIPNNQFSLILDLEQTHEEIKRNYRKSYKSLINKGKKELGSPYFSRRF